MRIDITDEIFCLLMHLDESMYYLISRKQSAMTIFSCLLLWASTTYECKMIKVMAILKIILRP